MNAQQVIVTGGTQGLGFAYAREFLRRGQNVLICGRSVASLDTAVAALAKDAASGARIVGQVCEVSELAQVQALWDRGVREFGRVDIWLHNAGYARTGVEFSRLEPTQIDAMVRGNVIGSMNAAQVVMAGMRKQSGDPAQVGSRGRLYLTLGGGGATGRVVPGMSVYSSTKRAVKYLAMTLLKESADARDVSVLVGTISPGVNITEGMLREMRDVPPESRAKALKQLNFIGEHVDTTAPWIVQRVLDDRKQGNDITWLTNGRMMGRALGMLFGPKRDLLSRYGLKA